MPDISMCLNDSCPLAKLCYRHEARPSCHQWYSEFKPDKDGNCSDFWPLRKAVEVRDVKR